MTDALDLLQDLPFLICMLWLAAAYPLPLV